MGEYTNIHEADQKCCSSPQHFRTGQLRNLPLFISQLKAIWLSTKILIKIHTKSTDSAILIWILLNWKNNYEV